MNNFVRFLVKFTFINFIVENQLSSESVNMFCKYQSLNLRSTII